MTRPGATALFLFAFLSTSALSACGSASYQDQARATLSSLESAVRHYNSASVHDAASTGQACRQALDSLRSTSMPNLSDAPRTQRNLARELGQALAEARRGFKDCA